MNDFNPGIQADGLFWTVAVPDDSVDVHPGAGTARFTLTVSGTEVQNGFGQALISVPALLAGRIAGAAVVSLAMACWCAANAGGGVTGGVVRAMLLYNSLMLALLLYARMGLGLLGIALWPAIIVHVLMAVWCVLGLKS